MRLPNEARQEHMRKCGARSPASLSGQGRCAIILQMTLLVAGDTVSYGRRRRASRAVINWVGDRWRHQVLCDIPSLSDRPRAETAAQPFSRRRMMHMRECRIAPVWSTQHDPQDRRGHGLVERGRRQRLRPFWSMGRDSLLSDPPNADLSILEGERLCQASWRYALLCCTATA
jgi:hypothetical protein